MSREKAIQEAIDVLELNTPAMGQTTGPLHLQCSFLIGELRKLQKVASVEEYVNQTSG